MSGVISFRLKGCLIFVLIPREEKAVLAGTLRAEPWHERRFSLRYSL